MSRRLRNSNPTWVSIHAVVESSDRSSGVPGNDAASGVPPELLNTKASSLWMPGEPWLVGKLDGSQWEHAGHSLQSRVVSLTMNSVSGISYLVCIHRGDHDSKFPTGPTPWLIVLSSTNGHCASSSPAYRIR